MAVPTTLPTLDPISPNTREQNTRPAGALGYFDEFEAVSAAENIIRNSARAAQEIGSATGDLLKTITGLGEAKPKAEAESSSSEKERLAIGGQTEVVFNNPDPVNHRKAQEVIRHYSRIDQEIKQVNSNQVQKLAEDIGRHSNGEFSVLDVAEAVQPNVTKPDPNSAQISEISINTALLVWNERAQKLELAKNPKAIAAKQGDDPSGFAMGENEMAKPLEREGHWARSVG